mgnify:CR=1 FL=1
MNTRRQLLTGMGAAALGGLGWAGWHAVRKQGFGLAQAAVVGFVLSFASHWTLPIFHNAVESLSLFVVNSTLFVVVALAGGGLARIVRSH